MKHSLQIAGLTLEFPNPFLPRRKGFYRRREMQRLNFDTEQGEKPRGECGDVFGLLSLLECTGGSMGFIPYFSVSPGTGFSCLNCRLAGNLFGCCESFHSLWKAEPGSRVGNSRTEDEWCGHWGCNGEDVFFLLPCSRCPSPIPSWQCHYGS